MYALRAQIATQQREWQDRRLTNTTMHERELVYHRKFGFVNHAHDTTYASAAEGNARVGKESLAAKKR